ncbi:hypothetical protein R1flu_007529 [Riccia fluitans]|uniref:Uncharacterized protein n=1 Tax=Riccia fluitans TaxID=41844 RepID=A0ABD1YZ47_9MARC
MIDCHPCQGSGHLLDAMETFPNKQNNNNNYSTAPPPTISSRLRTAFGRFPGGKKNKGVNAMENGSTMMRAQHEHDEDDEEQQQQHHGGGDSPHAAAAARSQRAKSSNLLSRLKLAFIMLLIYTVLWFTLRFIRLTATARSDLQLQESGMMTESVSTVSTQP